jgi:predicted ester cyclase
MTTAANRDLVRLFYEETLNRGNIAAIDAYVAPGAIEHEELAPGIPPGREGVKVFFAMLRAAFPDLHATIDDQIAEGDKVMASLTVRGTHQGEFMGIAPTGRQIAFRTIDIVRVADGQLVEHWGLTDSLALLQQLGVISDTQAADG